MVFNYSVSSVCNLCSIPKHHEMQPEVIKQILVYMTNLVEYKGVETYLLIEDGKMQIQALGSDRSAFLR